jgi:hypothetical protein
VVSDPPLRVVVSASNTGTTGGSPADHEYAAYGRSSTLVAAAPRTTPPNHTSPGPRSHHGRLLDARADRSLSERMDPHPEPAPPGALPFQSRPWVRPGVGRSCHISSNPPQSAADRARQPVAGGIRLWRSCCEHLADQALLAASCRCGGSVGGGWRRSGSASSTSAIWPTALERLLSGDRRLLYAAHFPDEVPGHGLDLLGCRSALKPLSVVM